jgi:hypothetical protein
VSFIIEKNTLAPGSVWDLDFWIDPKQTFLFNADGSNNEVRTLRRETGEIVGAFGRNGRNAGEFHWVHNLAVFRKATSTRPRWTRVSGHKNSAMSARQCGESSAADSFPQRDAFTHQAYSAIPIFAPFVAINAIAVADIEAALAAVPPKRVLDQRESGCGNLSSSVQECDGRVAAVGGKPHMLRLECTRCARTTPVVRLSKR